MNFLRMSTAAIEDRVSELSDYLRSRRFHGPPMDPPFELALVMAISDCGRYLRGLSTLPVVVQSISDVLCHRADAELDRLLTHIRVLLYGEEEIRTMRERFARANFREKWISRLNQSARTTPYPNAEAVKVSSEADDS